MVNIEELKSIAQDDTAAITEAYYILNYLEESEKKILPREVLDYLSSNKDDTLLNFTYITRYSIEEVSLNTKRIISYILLSLAN